MDTPVVPQLPLSVARHDAVELLPALYISSLLPSQQELVAAAIVVLDFKTQGRKGPRLFQLQATLSILAGWDLVVRAGTGARKTLAMMLAHLLQENTVVMTIAPLKQLQISQVRVVKLRLAFVCNFC